MICGIMLESESALIAINPSLW